jgi:hypothetical protein
MNKEAYEAGVKVALDKYGLSWEWLAKIYRENPYLAPAVTTGTIGAGIGGLFGGPREAAIGGIAGAGGSLIGSKAFNLLARRFENRALSDPALWNYWKSDPTYHRRMLSLARIGVTSGAALGISGLAHTLLPREPHPLEKL